MGSGFWVVLIFGVNGYLLELMVRERQGYWVSGIENPEFMGFRLSGDYLLRPFWVLEGFLPGAVIFSEATVVVIVWIQKKEKTQRQNMAKKKKRRKAWDDVPQTM